MTIIFKKINTFLILLSAMVLISGNAIAVPSECDDCTDLGYLMTTYPYPSPQYPTMADAIYACQTDNECYDVPVENDLWILIAGGLGLATLAFFGKKRFSSKSIFIKQMRKI